MSNKIYSFIAIAVIGALLLAAGCAQTATLALKFTPQDLATYQLTTEMARSIVWEGPLSKKPSAFKGGHTGNRIEMTFTEKVQSVDEKGNAIAEITIKELKYSAKVRDNAILDFDSSREKDQNHPLAKLIGQSYKIEITPKGQVSRVIDVNEAQASLRRVGVSSSAHKTALRLLSMESIKQRHTIAALAASGKEQLHPGDSWSDITSFSFDMMGSQSYQKIYTLKEIKNADNRKLAIVEMNAVPSSEMAQELHKEQATSLFSKLFDNTQTYMGELRLDLTTGKIERYTEQLQTEWIAVDPLGGKEDDKEPAALKMAATRLYRIERMD